MVLNWGMAWPRATTNMRLRSTPLAPSMSSFASLHYGAGRGRLKVLEAPFPGLGAEARER